MIFSTKGLSLDEWGWCLFFGLGVLLWHQVILTFPTHWLPNLAYGRGTTTEQLPSITEIDEIDRGDSRVELKRAQILWMRGLTRLQQQVGPDSALLPPPLPLGWALKDSFLPQKKRS